MQENLKVRPLVSQIEESELNAEYTPNNKFATGGIVTKLQSADFLMSHDKEMFLASGFDLSDARSFLVYGIHDGGTRFKC